MSFLSFIFFSTPPTKMDWINMEKNIIAFSLDMRKQQGTDFDSQFRKSNPKKPTLLIYISNYPERDTERLIGFDVNVIMWLLILLSRVLQS